LDAVRLVAKEVRDVPIAALARARKDDVAAAIEALEPAGIPPAAHFSGHLGFTSSRKAEIFLASRHWKQFLQRFDWAGSMLERWSFPPKTPAATDVRFCVRKV